MMSYRFLGSRFFFGQTWQFCRFRYGKERGSVRSKWSHPITRLPGEKFPENDDRLCRGKQRFADPSTNLGKVWCWSSKSSTLRGLPGCLKNLSGSQPAVVSRIFSFLPLGDDPIWLSHGVFWQGPKSIHESTQLSFKLWRSDQIRRWCEQYRELKDDMCAHLFKRNEQTQNPKSLALRFWTESHRDGHHIRLTRAFSVWQCMT